MNEIILAVSACLNVFLIFLIAFFKLHKKPKKTMSTDAQDLLRALMNSNAVLKIDVLDPGDFFLRSPKGRV